MSKIKIKTSLINKTENNSLIKEFLGLKIDNRIKYSDDDVNSIITINDNEILIQRKSNNYLIELPLSLNHSTHGFYDIYSLGKLNLDIQTTKLNIENNKIEASYILIFDEQEKVEMEFNLNYEMSN